MGGGGGGGRGLSLFQVHLIICLGPPFVFIAGAFINPTGTLLVVASFSLREFLNFSDSLCLDLFK